MAFTNVVVAGGGVLGSQVACLSSPALSLSFSMTAASWRLPRGRVV